MHIELADETVARVQAWADQARGVTEDDVINRALDCYEQAAEAKHETAPKDAKSILERFAKYQGMLKGATIEEIVASRHLGLP